MVATDRGTNLDRESVRVRRQSRLTPILGNAMSTKTTPQKAKRKNSKTSPPSSYAASMALMATHNLINMVAVSAVSGAVLLGLLAVKHF
jgi:hypothetical protein